MLDSGTGHQGDRADIETPRRTAPPPAMTVTARGGRTAARRAAPVAAPPPDSVLAPLLARVTAPLRDAPAPLRSPAPRITAPVRRPAPAPTAPLPQSLSPAANRIETLTGLRGLAVLIVFASHAANAGMLPAAMGRGAGQLGVMLFFVLSGFLMGALYLDRAPLPRMMQRYAAARLARVLPLFYVIVALSLAAASAGIAWPYPMPDLRTALENLLLVQGSRELWAVPVEVQFYGIFAALWLVVWRGGRFSARAFHAGVAVLVLLSAGQMAAQHLNLMPVPTVLTHVPYFTAGLVVAVHRARIEALLARLPGSARAGLGWAAAGALVASLPALRRALGVDLPIWADPATAAAVLGCFLAALVGAGPFRGLRHPAMQFLGEISYAVYLIHPILLVWGAGMADSGAAAAGPLAALAALAGSVALAAAIRGHEQAAPRAVRSAFATP